MRITIQHCVDLGQTADEAYEFRTLCQESRVQM